MRDLKADLELCQKATPGPWEYDGMHNEIHTPQGEEYFLIISECRAAPDQEFICDSFGHHYDNNFAFIAAAREGWPEAIERAIKAEEQVVKLQLTLQEIANPIKFLKQRADEQGAELNGLLALDLATDAGYIKGIAKKALAEQEVTP